eukprot:4936053-Alexandrium_andersonii.AAC.1
MLASRGASSQTESPRCHTNWPPKKGHRSHRRDIRDLIPRGSKEARNSGQLPQGGGKATSPGMGAETKNGGSGATGAGSRPAGRMTSLLHVPGALCDRHDRIEWDCDPHLIAMRGVAIPTSAPTRARSSARSQGCGLPCAWEGC